MGTGKIVLFFGAGAEYDFGLPTGPAFTKQSMLTKHDTLYEALSKFYQGRCNQTYCDTYRKEFLFRNNSHTYQKILCLSAKTLDAKLKLNPSLEQDMTLECRNLFQSAWNVWKAEEEDSAKSLSDEEKKVQLNEKIRLKELAEKAYETIMSKDGDKGAYKEIVENLTYYGAIEKDFSTIVDPKSAGINRFWRLLNYFWSAFFAIIQPALKNSRFVYQTMDEVLTHVNEVLHYVQSDAFLDNMEEYVEKASYYHQIKACFAEAELSELGIITTNYTRLCELCGSKNVAYLAGRINQFEYPITLEVKNIHNEQPIQADEFVFPYLLTQAQIKPLICEAQMREYATALQMLDTCEHIIMIGYSMCKEDNHIVSLLHSYIQDHNVRLSYLNYGGNANDQKEQVCQRLHLSSNHPNIFVYDYTKDTFEQVFQQAIQQQEKSMSIG